MSYIEELAQARARALLNRIVCVNFCLPSKHGCVLIKLLHTRHGCLSKPKRDRTSSCQFPEFSNTLAREHCCGPNLYGLMRQESVPTARLEYHS